ncbi:MAG: hypothetical protein WCV72_04120 [Patescibacteria group bacterium]|jgi:hypothetical protein
MIDDCTRVPREIIYACSEITDLVKGLNPKTRRAVKRIFDRGDDALLAIDSLAKKIGSKFRDTEEAAKLVSLRKKLLF